MGWTAWLVSLVTKDGPLLCRLEDMESYRQNLIRWEQIQSFSPEGDEEWVYTRTVQTDSGTIQQREICERLPEKFKKTGHHYVASGIPVTVGRRLIEAEDR